MPSYVAWALDEGITLLVLQVGNKPALLGLRKLIRSLTQHGKADPGPRHSPLPCQGPPGAGGDLRCLAECGW
jgi:hypothetical protein